MTPWKKKSDSTVCHYWCAWMIQTITSLKVFMERLALNVRILLALKMRALFLHKVRKRLVFNIRTLILLNIRTFLYLTIRTTLKLNVGTLLVLNVRILGQIQEQRTMIWWVLCKKRHSTTSKEVDYHPIKHVWLEAQYTNTTIFLSVLNVRILLSVCNVMFTLTLWIVSIFCPY